jgi:DNA-binding transcriptional ArsR family regulator
MIKQTGPYAAKDLCSMLNIGQNAVYGALTLLKRHGLIYIHSYEGRGKSKYPTPLYAFGVNISDAAIPEPQTYNGRKYRNENARYGGS